MNGPPGRSPEEKDPDGVDEAPIDPDDFQGRVVDGGDVTAADTPEHVQDEPDPDPQVQGVQRCRNKVEHPEQLARRRLRRLHNEIDRRHVVMDKVQIPFEAFDADKDKAETRGGEEPSDEIAAPPFGRGIDRQHHRQAAGQQDPDIDAAAPQHRILAGFGEFLWIGVAVDEIGEQQRAEKQCLSGDEHPHAELGRLALLRQGRILDLRPQGAASHWPSRSAA